MVINYMTFSWKATDLLLCHLESLHNVTDEHIVYLRIKCHKTKLFQRKISKLVGYLSGLWQKNTLPCL